MTLTSYKNIQHIGNGSQEGNQMEYDCEGIIGKQRPTLKDLLDMGAKNTNGAYGYAFLYIFPSAYGWVTHKAKVNSEVPSNTFNASDEALALLLWENNYHVWTAEKGSLLCEPKYTVRFIKEIQDDSSSVSKVKRDPGYGGWSFKGIRRFKELIDLVKIDRKTKARKELETKFLDMMKAQLDGKQVVKKKHKDNISQEELMMNSEIMWRGLMGEDEDDDDDEDEGQVSDNQNMTERNENMVVVPV